MQFEETIFIQAPASVIFEQYMQVENWSLWDESVENADLEGEFKIGAFGSLKPISGPKGTFTLSEVTLNQSFTTETKLPFCLITFEHSLREIESGIHVIHRVNFTGALSCLFSRLIGSSIKKGLPQAMQGLKSLCEQKTKP